MLIWLFFIVFHPVFKLGHFKINSSYYFIVIPSMVGFFYFYLKKEKNIIINNLLRVLILSSIFLIARQSTIFFQDITIINDLILGFINFFACFYFVKVYIRLNKININKKLLDDIYFIGLIHSIIVVSTFLFPSFKSFLYEYIWITPKALKYLLGESSGYRFQGIVQSGFSYLSTTHALFFILGVIKNKGYLNSSLFVIIKNIISQSIILLSIILIGRTGLIIVFISFMVIVSYGLFNLIKRLTITKRAIKNSYIFVVLFIIIINFIDLGNYERQIKFAFEYYYQFSETGILGTGSTDHLLKNEYFLPNNILEILFGTGAYAFGSHKYAVLRDVGWVRFISGSGILGIIIAYAIYFYSTYYAFKYFRIQSHLASFIIIYSILLIPLNLKDYYYLNVGSLSVFFIILFTFSILVEKNQCYGPSIKKCTIS